jgi:hypothetical protein
MAIPPDGHIYWEAKNSFETFAACRDMAMKNHLAFVMFPPNDVEILSENFESTWVRSRHKKLGESTRQFQCFPDTIDPRDVKGK